MFSKILSHVEHSLLIFSASVMSILAFSNIISRNILNHSISFTEEITINLFVLLTFVGTAVGVRNNAHLGFSLLYDKAGLRVKKVMTVLIGFIVIAVFLGFTYYGIKMVQFQMFTKQTTPSLGWQQWVFTLSLPLGSFLCLIRAIEATFKEFKNLQTESE